MPAKFIKNATNESRFRPNMPSLRSACALTGANPISGDLARRTIVWHCPTIHSGPPFFLGGKFVCRCFMLLMCFLYICKCVFLVGFDHRGDLSLEMGWICIWFKFLVSNSYFVCFCRNICGYVFCISMSICSLLFVLVCVRKSSMSLCVPYMCVHVCVCF